MGLDELRRQIAKAKNERRAARKAAAQVDQGARIADLKRQLDKVKVETETLRGGGRRPVDSEDIEEKKDGKPDKPRGRPS